MTPCARDGSTLKNTLFRGIAVGRCPDCMGVWVDGKELTNLVSKLSNEANPGNANHASLGQAKPGALACPQCAGGVAMMAVMRQGAEIDVCPQCRSVWMDKGEIDRAFPGRSGNARGLALAGAGAVTAGLTAEAALAQNAATGSTSSSAGIGDAVGTALDVADSVGLLGDVAEVGLGLIGAVFDIFS